MGGHPRLLAPHTQGMTTMVSVGAILVAGLLVYLLVALLYPEKLS